MLIYQLIEIVVDLQDYLLDEVSQEEAESQSQVQEDPNSIVAAVASPGVKKCQQWLLLTGSTGPASSVSLNGASTSAPSQESEQQQAIEENTDICIQKVCFQI